jgi:hypothetical protein
MGWYDDKVANTKIAHIITCHPVNAKYVEDWGKRNKWTSMISSERQYWIQHNL